MVGKSISELDVIEVLRQAEEPIVSTSEISGKLGFSRQYVDKFLRKSDSDRICSVNVGNSKGWYLDDTMHPAKIIEKQFEGKGITNVVRPDCKQCGTRLEEGDKITVLAERVADDFEIIDAICSDHSINRNEGLPAMGYDHYLQEAADYVEFAVLRGVCKRIEREPYDSTVLTDPVLIEYLPRTESSATAKFRPPEFDDNL